MSNETKWTPGPWVAYENAEDKCFYVAQQDGAPYTPDYSDVCGLECRTWSGERTIVQQANAHLIAAAPELYAALEDAVFRIRSTLILLECDDEFIARETEKARAALAKARGEHQ